MITPLAADPRSNFFKRILFMTNYSSSGFRQGYHTFLTATQIQPRGWEQKRPNTDLGQLQAQESDCFLWDLLSTDPLSSLEPSFPPPLPISQEISSSILCAGFALKQAKRFSDRRAHTHPTQRMAT